MNSDMTASIGTRILKPPENTMSAVKNKLAIIGFYMDYFLHMIRLLIFGAKEARPTPRARTKLLIRTTQRFVEATGIFQ